jgi:hypothetical protein
MINQPHLLHPRFFSEHCENAMIWPDGLGPIAKYCAGTSGSSSNSCGDHQRLCVSLINEYEALEQGFSLAGALIEARARAGLTQEQVAQRMNPRRPWSRDSKAAEVGLRRGLLKSTPGQPALGSKSALSRNEPGLKSAALND